MLVACGRIGFDDHNPIGGVTGDDDDIVGHDAQTTLPNDANAMAACTNAIPLMLAVRKPTNTCVGGDILDSCGPAATQEVVFKFTSPASNGYTFGAFDPGTNNISNSMQQLDANCQPMGGCTAFFGRNVPQGQTVFFVVEAAAGGCADVELEVQ